MNPKVYNPVGYSAVRDASQPNNCKRLVYHAIRSHVHNGETAEPKRIAFLRVVENKARVRPYLQVPKRKIFVTELFTLSDPIWVGDLAIFAILYF